MYELNLFLFIYLLILYNVLFYIDDVIYDCMIYLFFFFFYLIISWIFIGHIQQCLCYEDTSICWGNISTVVIGNCYYYICTQNLYVEYIMENICMYIILWIVECMIHEWCLLFAVHITSYLYF